MQTNETRLEKCQGTLTHEVMREEEENETNYAYVHPPANYLVR